MRRIIRTSGTKYSARFRYWSRKGYAAFSSLGKCVTIGCLRKNVTELALMKQPMLLATEPDEMRFTGETDEKVEKGSLPDLHLLSALLCLPQLKKVYCSCAADPLGFVAQLCIYNPLKRGYSPTAGELPLFLFPYYL